MSTSRVCTALTYDLPDVGALVDVSEMLSTVGAGDAWPCVVIMCVDGEVDVFHSDCAYAVTLTPGQWRYSAPLYAQVRSVYGPARVRLSPPDNVPGRRRVLGRIPVERPVGLVGVTIPCTLNCQHTVQLSDVAGADYTWVTLTCTSGKVVVFDGHTHYTHYLATGEVVKTWGPHDVREIHVWAATPTATITVDACVTPSATISVDAHNTTEAVWDHDYCSPTDVRARASGATAVDCRPYQEAAARNRLPEVHVGDWWEVTGLGVRQVEAVYGADAAGVWRIGVKLGGGLVCAASLRFCVRPARPPFPREERRSIGDEVVPWPDDLD